MELDKHLGQGVSEMLVLALATFNDDVRKLGDDALLYDEPNIILSPQALNELGEDISFDDRTPSRSEVATLVMAARVMQKRYEEQGGDSLPYSLNDASKWVLDDLDRIIEDLNTVNLNKKITSAPSR